MCSLATSDYTRAHPWHRLFCLLAWSCVRPRRHSSRLHLASLSCITTGTVCVLFSQSSSRLHSCVWVGRGSFGVRACTPVRGSGAARCSPRSCSVALLCRRTCTSATCDSCSRRCITDQVPRGQQAPLDHFRLVLIDQSAESVEPSLSVHGGTWCRSCEHQSSTHSADSRRISMLSSSTRVVDSSRSSRRGCHVLLSFSSSALSADSSRASC